jgi:hypothetical protein
MELNNKAEILCRELSGFAWRFRRDAKVSLLVIFLKKFPRHLCRPLFFHGFWIISVVFLPEPCVPEADLPPVGSTPLHKSVRDINHFNRYRMESSR